VLMQKNENMDVSAIRQKLRQETNRLHGAGRRPAELLAFCSGRPGAGISTLVWNLAAALAQRGCRCTILDGAANRKDVQSDHSEAISPSDWYSVLDSGIRLVNASRVFAALERCGDGSCEEIWRELQLLDAASDFVLIDTGSGSSDTALRFATLVDETIMVTTADVGMNADAFSVVRMLRDINPTLPVSIVINRASSLAEAREAFARINGATRKLGVSDVPGIGWVIEDDAMKSCREGGEAVVDAVPNSPAAKCLALLADMLVNRLKPAERQNPGGLPELLRSLGANLQRNAILRGL
jgi:flagellar biosynthesis protein FlhG